MKMKIVGMMLLVVMLVAIFAFWGEEEGSNEYDYLRLHIRANSNSTIDQNVKYLVKDSLVEYLTPYITTAESKSDAIDITKSLTDSMQIVCQQVLSENGFSYSVNIRIANEYFPTRTYANTTLQSGWYDAVIVELGEAVGDNWWCVMYPPLCFVNNFENSTQISFKSKIIEFFKEFFG